MIVRTIWTWLVGFVATMVLSSGVVIGSVFHAKPYLYEWIARNWGLVILWAAGIRVEVQNGQHIHMTEPQIVASNHQSWFDVFALAGVMPKKFRFVAKEELGRIPIFGRAWNTAGHISVNRSDRMQAIRTLNHFGKLVRENNSAIVIFPEGTRSWDGKLLPFKKGAFMLALHTHVDIVPTAVIGGRAIQKKGDWRIRKGRLIVRFGEPISTVGYSETNRDELIRIVQDRVAQLLSEGEGSL